MKEVQGGCAGPISAQSGAGAGEEGWWGEDREEHFQD